WCQAFDRKVLDGILHGASHLTVAVARWDRLFDEAVVDRLVNIVGSVTFGVGSSLRHIQTGRLRQYVMFIALGVVSLFILVFAFFPR
ncbi:MAG: NADH-quinone oxidoreductase subunit L, partial [Maioricimonas sp. JB045]